MSRYNVLIHDLSDEEIGKIYDFMCTDDVLGNKVCRLLKATKYDVII